MGIDFALANPNYKTLFELGRGSWSRVFAKADKYKCNESEYKDALALEIGEGIWGTERDASDEEDKKYQRLVATKLIEFMDGVPFCHHILWDTVKLTAPILNGVCIVNDVDDSESTLKYSNGYVYIGSRFHLDNQIEYADNIWKIIQIFQERQLIGIACHNDQLRITIRY